MSAAVRAALAAKRAEHRSRSSSPSKPSTPLPSGDDSGDTLTKSNLLPHFGRDLDASIASPFGSPKPTSRPGSAAAQRSSASSAPDMNLNQKSEEDIVRLSIQNGKVNLSSRSPSLQQVPALLLSLLADDPPSWFLQIPEDDRQPWYMREEVHTLQLSNNELASLPEKLAEFRGLKRLELHSNKLPSLPPAFFQLSALTTLSLSNNGLTSFPHCLLALDNLVTLNLSHNKIQTLWKESDVQSARTQRQAWDKENQTQENGVWAGLSPSKKDRKPLTANADPLNAPMRALRSLDLSHNRLSNAAFGIPDLANRRSKSSQNAQAEQTGVILLPTALKTLNLGYNSIRAPVSVSLFQNLAALEDLGLQGCGIGDDVFTSEGSVGASKDVLPSLSVLDLSGCELDDLVKIESLFGSQRIQSFDQAIGNVEAPSKPQEASEPAPGFSTRQLVRVLNRPTSADIDKMQDRCNAKVLCLLLQGNPLREEALRQKRGGRSAASPEKKAASPLPSTTTASRASPTDPTTAITTNSNAAAATATTVAATTAATAAGASQLPPKPKVVKEDWEILAESGLNTELGRRKLRIEQARREQEAAAAAAAAAAATAGSGSPTKPADEDSQPRGRKARAADEGVSSDPDAAGSGTDSRERGAAAGIDELVDDKDSGSALANAKLSSKKKEALGQVPCKFFRSNGCSAGASCPFAHTLPGDGGQKSVCQWFLKGNCRFGHKCALAHVLPGQPMSMDRKNKRAAQHGQPLPQPPQHAMAAGANVAGQPHLSPAGQAKSNAPRQASSQLSQTQAQGSNGPQQALPTRAGVAGPMPSQLPVQGSNRNASFASRDHDLPFGMPEDLHPGGPTGGVASADRAGFEGGALASAAVPDAPMSTSFTGSTSFQRPGSLSQSLSASLSAPQPFGGLDSSAAAAAFGTSASAARVFGSSPFSHPGGHSLFFSGSQDSEGGAGPFARSNRDTFGARSMGRLDDGAGLWTGMRGASSQSIGRGERDVEEIEDAEDFLPSSLSDLLTPAELERRRRSHGLSSSFAGKDERVTVAQSMPSHAGYGSSLGFGRSAIGAERAKASNIATGFQQQKQGGSGLDAYAFREGGSLSSSASRTAAHAPGQSLPQGLAAGLSRMHLRTGGTSDTGLADGVFGSVGATERPAFASSFSQSSQSALRVPGSLDEFALGPTAPSSVLPHRSPLGFAVGGGAAGRLSGSFAERPLNGAVGSPGSAAGSPFSPPLSAIGSHRQQAGEGGIAIPEGSAHKHAAAVGRFAPHPATQRLRAGSSAAAPHSPLTLPVVTAEEDEEEAIFELE
ncbi:uncharacterized protein PAN0_010c3974 [Moesziomyces antarcticus]|uniref:Uncharacterized protein n=2 Tax=Pseudozyma antarctica TaxID=84753 RepID=A0A081CGF8_PSEA2|nr:uncharacterized protein PAN0_010c3974 [Moesziomyces antarcticus]GAK65754.1 conserved hypothetical protein [Moesziomyces antarcticus]SPO45381.1 uncharacterized protein PSANT_03067 [Moesziomyces antarcticus]